MQSRDQHCSTRDETGSEASVRQLSQQVMIASSRIPLESCYEYSNMTVQIVRKFNPVCDDTVDDKDIVNSEIRAHAIKGEVELLF